MLAGEKAGWPRSSKSYRFRHVIGRGGFGAVYRATATLRDGATAEVAVKVMKKSLLTEANLVDRVLKEIEIQWQLQHAAIARLHTYFEDNKYVFLVTELCENGELFRYMRARKQPLSEPEARSVLLQLLDALEYLHSHGIIHRDLKLSNVLLDRNMRVKLCDFGLASKVDDPAREQATKIICGTPNYLAPEMLRGRFGLKSDVWGLGCMLITMLTGTPPFQGDGGVEATFARVKEARYSLAGAPSVSAAAQDLIWMLLQRNPADRPSLAAVRAHAFFNAGLGVQALLPADGASTAAAPARPSVKKAPSAAASVAGSRAALSDVSTGLGDLSLTSRVSRASRATFSSPPPIDTRFLRAFYKETKHCRARLFPCAVLCLWFASDDDVVLVAPLAERVTVVPAAKAGLAAATALAAADDAFAARAIACAAAREIPLDNLPRRLAARVQYAGRLVNLLASRAPEVVLSVSDCRSVLMSNRPHADFHMVFRNGTRVHAFLNKRRVEVKLAGPPAETHTIDLDRAQSGSVYLPRPAADAFAVFQRHLRVCLQAARDFASHARLGEPLRVGMVTRDGPDGPIYKAVLQASTAGRAAESSATSFTLVEGQSAAPRAPVELALKYPYPTRWIYQRDIGWCTKLVSAPPAGAATPSSPASGASAATTASHARRTPSAAADQVGVYQCLFNDGQRMVVDPLSQTIQWYALDSPGFTAFPIQQKHLSSSVRAKLVQFSSLLRAFMDSG